MGRLKERDYLEDLGIDENMLGMDWVLLGPDRGYDGLFQNM